MDKHNIDMPGGHHMKILTECEAHLVTTFRILSPLLKALVYSYMDRLMMREATGDADPAGEEEQFLAFVLPESEIMARLCGYKPSAGKYLLIAVSALQERATLYDISQDGMSLLAAETGQENVSRLCEAALATLERMPTLTAELISESYAEQLLDFVPRWPALKGYDNSSTSDENGKEGDHGKV